MTIGTSSPWRCNDERVSSPVRMTNDRYPTVNYPWMDAIPLETINLFRVLHNRVTTLRRFLQCKWRAIFYIFYELSANFGGFRPSNS